ncbi:transcription-repair coupling factor [Candidatus Albibeggiatoa sp. nov. NOAA]|uniref:transcription-repair coupling factor n=1 Tax=Candidatus Albibeggiatoa sp. nov. NOAA TaxID=3162724 RepID=UPI0032FD8425|nr:transcription-repair coupling factor [Thiotrichaceae bacterium]
MTDYTDPLKPQISIKVGQRQDWGNLQGSSISLVLSQLAQEHCLIVITPDSLTAQIINEEVQFYANDDVKAHHFPDWETLPYDLFSPHQDIISERLTTLYELPQLKTGLLVLPVTTLMHQLPPVDYVKTQALSLKIGQKFDLTDFRQQLVTSGYEDVSEVKEHGQFAVRGNILDLFPMGSQQPYRLDLFDDEIDSIRIFDPETQLTVEKIKQVNLLPAKEFPLHKAAIDLFRTQWRTQFGGDPTRCPVYQDVSSGLASAGIEYYFPLFFEQTATLFDYLPKNSVIVTVKSVIDEAEQFYKEINERYELLRHDIERPILPPKDIFLQSSQVFAEFKSYRHIHLTQSAQEKTGRTNFATQTPPNVPVDARLNNPIEKLQQFLADFDGKVLITAETTGRRETVLELFAKHGLKPKILDNWQQCLKSKQNCYLTIAPLQQGLWLDNEKPLVLITENQLFGERVSQRRSQQKANRDSDSIIRNLTELNLGAPVVHEEYGVGRYQGLVNLNVGDMPAEFLQLEYANQDKLYVPVSALHLISRFTGADPEHAPLHRLGSNQWEKAKRKAAKQVSDVAVELLDIHARRAAREGYGFQYDASDYASFASTFPFEETPDQQEAIDAVLADMHSAQAMDRLVCGDVGFGKTEVAMRAAFIAVNDGKQVAVLVPTTLLAQQHYQNFLDRFTDWAVKVEQLSRFRSKKQQNEALEQIEQGEVDIVIGTHKLLQDNIKFKNLGLVIIDEEHRFGVKQKEQFKKLRSEVDILTLTATPIPRSLNMALSNLRDLSIIATPPSRRLAVKTFVKQWQDATMVEAITRELKRGGQVYFLHNDIETIENMVHKIDKLIPEARVEFAHGKMRERELEHVMQDFYHRRFNVLVCTTIIETGIDVPSANTIIINRADKFGLAQLYQLRGRVGRSHHRAYAYLIVPPKKVMTKDAVKRLDAISSIEELGMGFTLATHDLEIRGAGELLGDGQSGHIQQIGYSLYTELLERAVQALKEGKQPELEKPLTKGTEIDLHTPALLPSDYLPDVHTRLIMYKRLANAVTSDALREIQVEMIDRFGLLPDHAKNLMQVTELKLKSTPLGIRKIDIGLEGGYFLFEDEPNIDPMKLVQLIQKQPQKYKLEGQHKLRLMWATGDFTDRLNAVESVLNMLG